MANEGTACRDLFDIISEKELRYIVKKATGSEEWQVVEHQTKPASEGLIGFLGDHFKVTLQLQRNEQLKKVHLFVKCMPLTNDIKAKYIDQNNFFRRETMMLNLFDELGGDDGATPWHAKVYLHNDRVIVMPDLTAQGYASQPYNEILDLAHILVVAASTARFHAAFANYVAKKSSNGERFNILHEFGETLAEPTFLDSPFMRAGAKSTTNLLKNFSNKYKDVPDLEENIIRLCLEACETLKDYPDTLNVLLHKDLWANNIMFRHEGGAPVNAVLVDFQCLRYGPPAFDISTLLHLTTSRSFREQHERCVLQHYFSTFSESLEDITKSLLKDLEYDFDEFVLWYEKSRKFALTLAVTILAFGLMDPVSAAKAFDDPATFQSNVNEDRSPPVLEYCLSTPQYKHRLLELTEEFLERYLVNKK